MSDEANATEDGEEAPKKKLSGKVLVLFIVLPLLLIAGGGGAAYYFLFMTAENTEETADGEKADGEKDGETEGDSGKVVFYDLPEMLVNMNNRGRRKSFLKITVSLELDSDKAIPELEAVMPRIVDNFQIYLRELRLEDLKGSAGLLRLKEELLLRINVTARPIKVNDVLFKEMLVQ